MPTLASSATCAVVAALARDPGHRGARAVGDHGEARRQQRIAGPFVELDRGVGRRAADVRHRRAEAHVGARARELGVDRVLQRDVRHDVAERREPLLRRRAGASTPKPPACEMSMVSIGVTASRVATSRRPHAEALEDQARAVRQRERAVARAASRPARGRRARRTSRSASAIASASVPPTGPAPTMTTSCMRSPLSARRRPRPRPPSWAWRPSGSRARSRSPARRPRCARRCSRTVSGTFSAGRM